jgi:hypothetical protein
VIVGGSEWRGQPAGCRQINTDRALVVDGWMFAWSAAECNARVLEVESVMNFQREAARVALRTRAFVTIALRVCHHCTSRSFSPAERPNCLQDFGESRLTVFQAKTAVVH